MSDRGPWMQVYPSRGRFYPLDQPERMRRDVRLTDLAQALGNICRFGGHCEFYSVAQHSVHVSEIIEVGDCADREAVRIRRLAALLHDSGEAYTGWGDVIRPVKSYLQVVVMDGEVPLTAIETGVHLAVRVALAPAVDWIVDGRAVERADLTMLATEAAHFYPDTWREWNLGGAEPHGTLMIVPALPDMARGMFIARYEELTPHCNFKVRKVLRDYKSGAIHPIL